MLEPNKLKNRYKELDALRGIAALMVVFFHFTMGRRDEYNSFFKLGTTGVDLFFIISGFVIFLSINQVSNIKEFIINRVSRLYPTYWTAVSFTFIFIVSIALQAKTFGTEHLFLKYLANLTMFHFYLDTDNLDGPYWTMIIEMLFYITIMIFYRFKILSHIRTIGVITCIIIFISNNFYFDNYYVQYYMLWVPIFQFIPLFFSGILFYKLYHEKQHKLINYLIIILCLICQITFFTFSGRSSSFISQFQYATMLTIYFTLFTLFVNHKLQFIVNRFTLFMGKISFALYLIHQFVSLKYIIPYFHLELGINFWVVTFLINLPILIIIASIITFKVEVPLSKKMKNVLLEKFNSKKIQEESLS